MRAALSKALRELSKTQKVGLLWTTASIGVFGASNTAEGLNFALHLQKRDAYKRKCVEAHERYKSLVERASYQESKLLQLQHEHATELQQLLAQLSEVESDKTALMQRQIDSGVAPTAAAAVSSKKVATFILLNQ